MECFSSLVMDYDFILWFYWKTSSHARNQSHSVTDSQKSCRECFNICLKKTTIPSFTVFTHQTFFIWAFNESFDSHCFVNNQRSLSPSCEVVMPPVVVIAGLGVEVSSHSLPRNERVILVTQIRQGLSAFLCLSWFISLPHAEITSCLNGLHRSGHVPFHHCFVLLLDFLVLMGNILETP